MTETVLIVAGVIFVLGLLAFIVLLVRTRTGPTDSLAQQRMAELTGRVTDLGNALDMERKMNSERIAHMKETFASLAAEALQRNNEGFLSLADETFKRHREGAAMDLDKREKAIEGLVKPVKDSLDKFESKVQELEKARVGAYESITAQVNGLLQSQRDLRSETTNLVHALKTPRVRGRWGEIQLRRVVELAGMLDHCDFLEQQSVTTESGRLRPDLIVRLPGNTTIVVDAKSPLDQYLFAMEAPDDDTRHGHLTQYAVQIRGHMSALGNKAYWSQFKPAPEFVFMFLPGESFYSAALEADPALIEGNSSQRVILATPTTLITLLKAVAYGWRQEKLAADAEKIGTLGKELYERISTLGIHFFGLGTSLRTAVEKYNDAVGTLETRVLISARRFKEMPITPSDKEIVVTSQIDTVPRHLQSPELTGPNDQPGAGIVPDSGPRKLEAGE